MSEKDKPDEVVEVFQRGTLVVKVERSERRGRSFLWVDDRYHKLTTEELEALGRFLISSARRLLR